MFAQLYLNDSFMIRKIIVAAVPAALLATTAALSTTAPANAQFGGAHGGALLTSGSFTMMAADSFEQGFSVEGGPNDPAQYPGGANTNQVYPNNQSSGGGAFAGAQSTNGSFTMMGSYNY